MNKNGLIKTMITLAVSLVFVPTVNAYLPDYSLSQKIRITQQPLVTDDLSFVRYYLNSDLAKVRDPRHATQFYLRSRKQAKSILIMHGLYESPNYMRSLALQFFQAGYNVVNLRLDGHFEKEKFSDLNVKAESWQQNAENGLRLAKIIGEQVEVLGYSTGGTLGVYLALKYPQIIKKLYLISPALKLSLPVNTAVSTLGHTDLSTWSMCDDVKSIICKIANVPSQLSSKINDGLEVTPAMGLEVARLIDLVVNQFATEAISFPGDSVGNTKIQQMLSAYMKMKTPLYMVNTDLDAIVDKSFNKKFASQYPFLVKSMSYARSEGVRHDNINKNYLDRLGETKKFSFNHSFAKIIELFDLD